VFDRYVCSLKARAKSNKAKGSYQMQVQVRKLNSNGKPLFKDAPERQSVFAGRLKVVENRIHKQGRVVITASIIDTIDVNASILIELYDAVLHMLDYAVETAFRSDTRRLANGDQLRIALNMALSVGVSKFWRGFTRGKHRTVEMLHPLPRVARSSGPMKGRHPISSANGRPPR
jgi:hypothetical protein